MTGMDMGLTVLELLFPVNCASPLSFIPSSVPLISGPVSLTLSGVAKGANVVAVKVLDDDGTGQNSDM